MVNFSVKITRRRPTKSTKQHEVHLLSLTSPTFLKSWVTTDKDRDTYKMVLWGKENIGIDAWHEIRKKLTMLQLSKPHDLFHFHVNYREVWNGSINFRDSWFVIFNSRESCKGPLPIRPLNSGEVKKLNHWWANSPSLFSFYQAFFFFFKRKRHCLK